MRRVLVPHEISPTLPAPGSVVVDYRGETMGTTWSVRFVSNSRSTRPGNVAAKLRDWQHEIQQQLDTVVAEMSHWEPESNLGRFNRAAPGTWHALPDAFFDVLGYALEVAESSGGAYDPAAGALVNLWGFGPVNRHDAPDFCLPDSAALASARLHSGWQRIVFDRGGRRVFQPGGVLLDLSAVAKGYAVDRVAEYLRRHGVIHYLVEVGGELRGGGLKPDCLPWWVALEQPPPTQVGDGDGSPGETVVALHDLSIATSGDYRRFYRTDAGTLAHTVDPRSGRPLQNGIASVTVLHASCMAADALSTALGVLGVESGLLFAENNRIAARFLTRGEAGFTEHVSHAFTALLQ